MRQAPAFWAAGTQSVWPIVLSPLSVLWRLGAALRGGAGAEVGAPVIAIGNLVVGGAGKTPTAIAVAERLAALGRKPAFISRGYGGALRGPVRVTDQDAALVGDEPLLLARTAPTWVARDRAAGARAAVAAGADVLVLDDAHQNRALRKHLSLVVVDAAYGFGNGRVLPAGPLRETVATGLARAGAVVLIGAGTPPLPPGLPVLRGALEPADTRLRGRRVLAFAGIGRPEKFFASLRALGCTLVDTRAFPDHHPYRPDEVMRLVETAVQAGATPVTTEKDQVRLPPDARAMVEVLPVRLQFADAAPLDHLLDQACRGR